MGITGQTENLIKAQPRLAKPVNNAASCEEISDIWSLNALSRTRSRWLIRSPQAWGILVWSSLS